MKKNPHPINVIFDLDDTLWKIRSHVEHPDQVPDYDLIQVLRWFYNNGDNVFAWSAGGQDYCQTIITKLGLDEMVKVIPKVDLGETHPKMDLSFDDSEMGLAKINVMVNRDHSK